MMVGSFSNWGEYQLMEEQVLRLWIMIGGAPIQNKSRVYKSGTRC